MLSEQLKENSWFVHGEKENNQVRQKCIAHVEAQRGKKEKVLLLSFTIPNTCMSMFEARKPFCVCLCDILCVYSCKHVMHVRRSRITIRENTLMSLDLTFKCPLDLILWNRCFS